MPRIDGLEGATNYSNWGGSSWYVMASAPNKDAAIDFLATVCQSNGESVRAAADVFGPLLWNRMADVRLLSPGEVEAGEVDVKVVLYSAVLFATRSRRSSDTTVGNPTNLAL